MGATFLERRLEGPAVDEPGENFEWRGGGVGAEERLRITHAGWIAREHPADRRRRQSGVIPDRRSGREFENAALIAIPIGLSLAQRVALLSSAWESLGSGRPFLGGRPSCPGLRAGAGANRLASRRSRVTRQTWRRTAAIRSSAEKLESATTMILRLGAHRRTWRMAWRAQSVSFLWRRRCAAA